MLVIGHRGAAGLAPENTIKALQTGKNVGADILEFDIRLTSDNIPILAHDAKLYGKTIHLHPIDELQRLGKITTLESALDAFFGKIILNIEFKPSTGSLIVLDLLKNKYIKSADDWDSLYISSFHIKALSELRTASADVSLALVHSINPFSFVTQHKNLKLSAVGWHRLHVNALATQIAKKFDLFTYVYTVNRVDTATRLAQKGIDGIVTDYPDRLAEII